MQEEKRELHTETDETLVSMAQSGDKTAEAELLLRYRNLVRFYARKFFLVGGEAEDLIQEGMIGLYQAIGSFKTNGADKRSFKKFASLCVWRQIIDAVKVAAGKKNEPLKDYVSIADEGMSLTELDPEQTVILNDDRKELNDKMSRILTDTEFKVFTMYMDGRSCAEICEITGKAYKSVDNAVQRSKQKLRKALQNNRRKGE
ncbi:MAG: sigma-70 family RNA polymerase sigma factor [Clostridiales bacterium]|nr:sigma-70 family RNA polymerase sigma factor [Clostridiales bacterium]